MEFITPFVGKNLHKKKEEDEIFKQNHLNCQLKCENCSKLFECQETFNLHLDSCINIENIPSLKEKIVLTENRSDIIAAAKFRRHKKGSGKRVQRLCFKCGDHVRSRWEDVAEHICKTIDNCYICGSAIPASLLEIHTNKCLESAKSVLDNLESRHQLELAQESDKKNEKNENPAPSKVSDSTQTSRTSSSQDSASSQGSGYDEKLSQTRKRNDARRNAYYQDKVVSNLTQILETSVSNDKKPEDPIIETRSMHINEPTSPNKEATDKTNPDPKTESISDVLLKHTRRSKELNSLIDARPIVDFFKSCSSNSEKRLILASTLKDNMMEEDFAFYAKLFNVKKSFIRECHSERLIKQCEGMSYKIESIKNNNGQINLPEEVKDKIISAIDDHSQLWPGKNELVHRRVSAVTDRSLKRFYDLRMKIEPVRNRDHYTGSRKVLPMSFRAFFDEKIKPKFDISYGQFRNLIPFNCFEICMGWSQYCICFMCANNSYFLQLLKKVGENHNIKDLQELNFETCMDHFVCSPKDDMTTLNCFRKRFHRYCFLHTRHNKQCQHCLHSCESKLKTFIMDLLVDIDLDYQIRFSRLVNFGESNERWLPIDGTSKESQLPVMDAISLAVEHIENSLPHLYDLKSYQTNKIIWSFSKKIFPPAKVSVFTVDHGSPFSLDIPEMGQSAKLSKENNFYNCSAEWCFFGYDENGISDQFMAVFHVISSVKDTRSFFYFIENAARSIIRQNYPTAKIDEDRVIIVLDNASSEQKNKFFASSLKAAKYPRALFFKVERHSKSRIDSHHKLEFKIEYL